MDDTSNLISISSSASSESQISTQGESHGSSSSNQHSSKSGDSRQHGSRSSSSSKSASSKPHSSKKSDSQRPSSSSQPSSSKPSKSSHGPSSSSKPPKPSHSPSSSSKPPSSSNQSSSSKPPKPSHGPSSSSKPPSSSSQSSSSKLSKPSHGPSSSSKPPKPSHDPSSSSKPPSSSSQSLSSKPPKPSHGPSSSSKPPSSSSQPSSSKPSKPSHGPSSSSKPPKPRHGPSSSSKPPSSSSQPSSSKPPKPSHRPCSSSKPPKEDTRIEKNQIVLPDRFHEHALTMMSAAREPYRCSGCKEQGFGRSYRCENRDCSYVLHEECAIAVLHRKNHVSHSFFKGQEFWFLEKPLGYPRVCDACRMDVRGFVYHRKATKDVYDTGLDLHPCCLKLRDNFSYEESHATKTLTLQRNIEKECVKCKSRKVGDDSKVEGWSYKTSDGDYYHVSCLKKFFLDELLKEEGFSEEKVVVSKMQANNDNMKVVKVGESSKSIGSVIMKVVTKLGPMVFKVAFSLILGHPLPLLLDVIDALTS